MNINELTHWKHDHLPSEADIASLESKHGIRFPADYRDFLNSHNGGHFRGEVFFALEGVRFGLASLFGINVGYPQSELCGRNLALIECNSPIEVVPIGRTEENFLLVIVVVDEEDFGHVILKTFDEAKKAFSSFSEFVGALKIRQKRNV